MRLRGKPVVTVAVAPRQKAQWLEYIDEWAVGRSRLVRVPVLLYFGYVWYRHADNPFYASLLGGFDLIIHELGHFLWAFLGEYASILGGSLTQCLAPIAAAIVFFRQRDFFAIAVCACWLGVNLYEVATYAADGLTQQLPLVSPVGDDPIHDWGYILGRWEKLSKAREIGETFRTFGAAFLSIGLFGGVWLLTRMRPAKLGQESAE